MIKNPLAQFKKINPYQILNQMFRLVNSIEQKIPKLKMSYHVNHFFSIN